ncbi:MAG: YjbQ family protein [Methanothrix sp.]|nr:YjbQ family protein [Methanothrix sp.]
MSHAALLNTYRKPQKLYRPEIVDVIVERGRLAMGTWQRILFFELDGPRHRSISVRVMAD